MPLLKGRNHSIFVVANLPLIWYHTLFQHQNHPDTVTFIPITPFSAYFLYFLNSALTHPQRQQNPMILNRITNVFSHVAAVSHQPGLSGKSSKFWYASDGIAASANIPNNPHSPNPFSFMAILKLPFSPHPLPQELRSFQYGVGAVVS
mmetsp:Transcript_40788/g.85682  ORF Transcript_40788/g.85682 Transcript_40788/m.85682 type:complete len:148 (-) Transcript_40788:1467-1910(-)